MATSTTEINASIYTAVDAGAGLSCYNRAQVEVEVVLAAALPAPTVIGYLLKSREAVSRDAMTGNFYAKLTKGQASPAFVVVGA